MLVFAPLQSSPLALILQLDIWALRNPAASTFSVASDELSIGLYITFLSTQSHTSRLTGLQHCIFRLLRLKFVACVCASASFFSLENKFDNKAHIKTSSDLPQSDHQPTLPSDVDNPSALLHLSSTTFCYRHTPSVSVTLLHLPTCRRASQLSTDST